MQKNIQALESVQKRSARFVLNNYSPYDNVFDMLSWSSLANRQKEHRLLMLHKIIYYLVDITADSLLPLRPCNHAMSGHPNRFAQLPARTNAYSNSFLPSMELFIKQ